jgi:hypothetical protein
MLESVYKRKLIGRIEKRFPGCLILKNDPTYLQGVPDLLVLWNDKWGALEVKIDVDEHIQPNQEYYVHMMNRMSFAAFISPENEEAVLNDLQAAFGATNWRPRVSQSK